MPYSQKTNDSIDVYVAAYLEAYAKSQANSVTGKKREARKFAGEIEPEIGAAIEARGKALGTNRPGGLNEQEALGQHVSGVLGRAMFKKFDTNKSRLHKDLPMFAQPAESAPVATPSQDEKPKTILARYRKWAEENDHIANDYELAYWTGVSRSGFTSARSALKEAGFEFQSENGSGWKVVKRPANEKVYSKQEVVAMFANWLETNQAAKK